MRFFYYDGKGIQGPLEPEELLRQAGFSSESLVCPAGSQKSDDWKPAVNYDALREALLKPKPAAVPVNCSRCGHSNPGEAVFCNHCGGRVDGKGEAQPAAGPPMASPPMAAGPMGGQHRSGGMGRIGQIEGLARPAVPETPTAPTVDLSAKTLPVASLPARPVPDLFPPADMPGASRSGGKRLLLAAAACLLVGGGAAAYILIKHRAKGSKAPADPAPAAAPAAPGPSPALAAAPPPEAAVSRAVPPAPAAGPRRRRKGGTPPAAPPAAVGQAVSPGPPAKTPGRRKAAASPAPPNEDLENLLEANSRPRWGRKSAGNAVPDHAAPAPELILPGVPKKVRRKAAPAEVVPQDESEAAPAPEARPSGAPPTPNELMIQSAKDEFLFCHQLMRQGEFDDAFEACLCPAVKQGPPYNGRKNVFVERSAEDPQTEAGSTFEVLSSKAEKQAVLITGRWTLAEGSVVERTERWMMGEGNWCMSTGEK